MERNQCWFSSFFQDVVFNHFRDSEGLSWQIFRWEFMRCVQRSCKSQQEAELNISKKSKFCTTQWGKYTSNGKNRKLGKKMLGHNFSIFYEGLAKFLFSYWTLHFELIFFNKQICAYPSFLSTSDLYNVTRSIRI